MILAIDPSYDRHAWACIGGPARYPTLTAWGRDLWQDCPPVVDTVAIEMIASYGMPVGAEVFETCVEIGRLMARYPKSVRITRQRVKLSVCRSAKATDANIRTAVIDRFGGPEQTRKGGALYKCSHDVWAAIAVGLAMLDPEAELYEPPQRGV